MTRTLVTLTRDDRLIVHRVGDPLELWDQLRRAYLARRPALVGRDGWRYPATTYLDVVEVANALELALANTLGRARLDLQHAAAWRAAYVQIFEALNHHNLTETFGENELFWLHFTLQLAIHLSAARDQARTPWERRMLGKLPFTPVATP
ncbi:MAG: hypothetical protein HS111_26300 [Kofleriaceae bacterium]|nr:hypothetical protein [Kofleriaceae bacterium]MCL4227292.1 hypothetical protein [Myxococcales bacterium]